MTITTADDALCRIVEPNVCPTSRRIEVLCEMRKRGIPTVIWMCPLLPFINDTPENVKAIVEMAHSAGVYGIISFGMGLTLRSGDREYYYNALDRHFPGLKAQYIRCFGNNYEIPSPRSGLLWKIFTEECDRYGICRDANAVFSYLNTLEEPEQLTIEI